VPRYGTGLPYLGAALAGPWLHVVRAFSARVEAPWVALRVVVEGTKGGAAKKLGWELLDYYDESRGISAMMRTTGYSLSITGQMQASGEIQPGVHTPDECMPAEKYITELAKRGVKIKAIQP